MYASFDSIRATLDYDFSQEKNFSYEGLTIDEAVRHIAKDIQQPITKLTLQRKATGIIKIIRGTEEYLMILF